MMQKAIPIQMKRLVTNGEWIIRLSQPLSSIGLDVESNLVIIQLIVHDRLQIYKRRWPMKHAQREIVAFRKRIVG